MRGAVHLPLSQIAEEEQKSDSASSQCLLSTVHLPHTANIFCHRQNLSRTSTVQIRQIVIVEPLCCAVIRVATLDIYTRYLHWISTRISAPGPLPGGQYHEAMVGTRRSNQTYTMTTQILSKTTLNYIRYLSTLTFNSLGLMRME